MVRIRRALQIAFAPAAFVALALNHSAAAMEPLTAPELVTACKAYEEERESPGESPGKSPGATTCRAFIQGYVSASTEIVATEDRPSEFVARAIRTRTSRFSEDAEQKRNSRYCLPESQSIDVLIARVASISQPLAKEATAESVIVQVLENHYRCEGVIKQ
mgnify:CR=1 FL=1